MRITIDLLGWFRSKEMAGIACQESELVCVGNVIKKNALLLLCEIDLFKWLMQRDTQ